MEYIRRVIEQRRAQTEELAKKEQFQKGCRQLAASLFHLLIYKDPCGTTVDFEGRSPLNPYRNVSGRILGFCSGITAGENGPYLDYYRFVLDVPNKDTSGSMQKVKLYKKNGTRVVEWVLETITETEVSGKTYRVSNLVTDPTLVEKIMERSEEWDCKRTTRFLNNLST